MYVFVNNLDVAAKKLLRKTIFFVVIILHSQLALLEREHDHSI
jgi:hypothetical protein